MPKKTQHLENLGTSKEIDPVSGTPVTRVRLRRGILRRETTHYENIHAALTALSKADPRAELERYRSEARVILRTAGLPTDEDHGEVRLADGRIVPNDSAEAKAMLPGTSYKRWSKIVGEQTEHLSPENLAMDLIEKLNAILNGKYDNDQLWHICALMQASCKFEIGAKGINEAVVAGRKSVAGRQKGPEAKRERAHKKEEVVQNVLDEHLRKNPRLQIGSPPRLKPKKATEVARTIEGAVNSRLREEGLGPLSRESICKYVKKIDQGRLSN